MDSNILQQRAFILSSLRRLDVPISTYAYRFADKVIKEGWMPSSGNLKEVDAKIELKYLEFINGQG
jgi:hypothetical protein